MLAHLFHADNIIANRQTVRLEYKFRNIPCDCYAKDTTFQSGRKEICAHYIDVTPILKYYGISKRRFTELKKYPVKCKSVNAHDLYGDKRTINNVVYYRVSYVEKRLEALVKTRPYLTKLRDEYFAANEYKVRRQKLK